MCLFNCWSSVHVIHHNCQRHSRHVTDYGRSLILAWGEHQFKFDQGLQLFGHKTSLKHFLFKAGPTCYSLTNFEKDIKKISDDDAL